MKSQLCSANSCFGILILRELVILYVCKAPADNKRHNCAMKDIVVIDAVNIAHLNSLKMCPAY